MAWVCGPNSNCIFNLEKKCVSNENILSLFINNTLSNDPSVISSRVFTFDKNLYTSSFDPDASSLCFHKIKSVLPFELF